MKANHLTTAGVESRFKDFLKLINKRENAHSMMFLINLNFRYSSVCMNNAFLSLRTITVSKKKIHWIGKVIEPTVDNYLG
jgi:hypothetical protein